MLFSISFKPSINQPVVQHRKYSRSAGITNSYIGLSGCIAKIHKKSSNSKSTRLPKSGMYLLPKLLSVAAAS